MSTAAVILAYFLFTAAPQVAESPAPVVARLDVRGNRRVPAETIRYNLRSKPGEKVDTGLIRRDVKTLYGLGHFNDIRVDLEETADGVVLVFIVQEKSLIRSVKYEGLNSITNSEVIEKLREKKLSMTQESPYDPARVRQVEATIRAMLAEKGHQDATVDPIVEDVPPSRVNVTFKVTEGPKVRIERITIEGNRLLSERAIRNAMKLIKEAGPLTVFNGKDTYHDLKLADDLTRIRILYAENGYARANVLEPIVEVKPHTVHRTLPFLRPPFPWGIPIPFAKKTLDRYFITIKVEENDQYRIGSVNVVGAKQFNELFIRAVLGLIPGAVYNETALRKSFENLKKLYGARGHINFTAIPAQDFDEQKKIVNLTINIDEDRQFLVNRIEVTGNTTTRDKVIRRELMVDEGQVFNSSLWDVSVLRLNQLGYFEEIKTEDAEIKPHATESTVDVSLKVKEKSRNSIGFSGGVSGVGGSFLGMNYSTNNFLGLGESMSVSLQGGTRQSQYQFSFTEPYMANRPISTGFSVFSTSFRYDQARESLGIDPGQIQAGTDLDNRLNFEQQQKGFSVSASYPLRIFQRFGVTFQANTSRTTAINPATQEFFNAVTTQEQQNFQSTTGGTYAPYRSQRLVPSFSVNTTNSPFNPTRGYSLTGTLEFSGGFLGGNVNFYRPTIDYRVFRPMKNGRNTLAIRAMASYLQGFNNVSVPFYERFFAGGDYDLRGFDFRSISPISFITRSTEVTDFITGKTSTLKYDDIVYVGGDTQGIVNIEYRIPLGGPITLAPFADIGNSWVLKKRALLRKEVDALGHVKQEGVQFLPGTNSGVRISAGLELGVVMPVINQPFRLIFALNPARISRRYVGPVSGNAFSIREPAHDFKFTVGKTF